MNININLEIVLAILTIVSILLGAAAVIFRQYSKINVTMALIQRDISDIKKDHKSYDTSIKELTERLVKVEASAKSAHHRMDDLVGVENKKESQEVG